MTHPTMGPFEVFYASPVQHPGLLWLAALLAAVAVLTRRGVDPGLRRYLLLLAGLSLADAWLTTSPVPGLGTLPAPLGTFVPLFFVLAGDFRYLLLVESGTPQGGIAPDRGRLLRALCWTLPVPILSQAATALLGADARTLYFIYEVSFFALAAGLAARHPNPTRAPWLRRVSFFVMLYYGLWASADAVLLLTGADWGYGLRVVPNLLYYGGLIAAMAWFAPVSGRDG